MRDFKMTRTKKIVAAAAIVVASTFGVAGVASAHEGGHGHGHGRDHGRSHGRHHDGLIGGLLHTVGHLLRDL